MNGGPLDPQSKYWGSSERSRTSSLRSHANPGYQQSAPDAYQFYLDATTDVCSLLLSAAGATIAGAN